MKTSYLSPEDVAAGKKALAEIGERTRQRGRILELSSSAESPPIILQEPPPPEPPRLQPLGVADFLALNIKPREMLLGPILPQKGLMMLYGIRGTGKTMVVLGLAYALATGTGFLKWKADKPRKVLLVDGEMPAAALQGCRRDRRWCRLRTTTGVPVHAYGGDPRQRGRELGADSGLSAAAAPTQHLSCNRPPCQ